MGLLTGFKLQLYLMVLVHQFSTSAKRIILPNYYLTMRLLSV